MTKIELIGNLRGTLDTYDDVSIPLTFSLANIKEPGKRSGLYSKTILLPGTPNNNQLLSYYFDVNIDTTVTQFNIYRKQGVRLIQDGVTIYDNLLMKLLRVNKRQNTQTLENFVEYEIEIKDYSSDFFNQIASKQLSDINLSEFDHILNQTNIIDSWDYDWRAGYLYPYTHQDAEATIDIPASSINVLTVNRMRPMLWVKQIFDKIHKLSGYGWKWTNNDWVNVNFDKLLMSDNKSDKTYVDEVNSINQIVAKSDDEIGYTYGYKARYTTLNPFSILSYMPLIFNDEVKDNFNKLDTLTSSPFFNYNPSDSQPGFISEVGGGTTAISEFPNIQTYYTSQFDFTGVPSLEFKVGVNIKTKVKNLTSFTGTLVSTDPSPSAKQVIFYVEIYNYTKNTRIYKEAGRININSLFPLDPFAENSGEKYVEVIFNNVGNTGEIVNDLNIEVGDIIIINLDNNFNNQNWYVTGAGTSNIEFEYSFNKANLTINVEGIPTGSQVPMNTLIPQKITQREFIDSIIKMYNLYVYPNPENPTEIIYEQRDNYYDRGEIKDWTSKLARDRDQILEFLPDLTSKSIEFTYKTDEDDLLNKSYTQATKEVWGKQTVDFTSEWVRGTQNIELIFGPSPITNPPVSILIPSFTRSFPYIDYNLIKNPKIMIWSGYRDLIDGTQGVYMTDSPSATSGIFVTEAPYISHQNNEFNPGFDLNFGINDFYFEEGVTPSNLNLYTFWRRTMKQIDTARQLTAYFNLTPLDITNLKLNDKIRIDNSYWIINEIQDYNANSRDLTKVILISIEDEMVLFTPSGSPINCSDCIVVSFDATVEGDTTSFNVTMNNEDGVYTGEDLGEQFKLEQVDDQWVFSALGDVDYVVVATSELLCDCPRDCETWTISELYSEIITNFEISLC